MHNYKDYLQPKFQLNFNLLTVVNAPQMGPIGSLRKKGSCFFWVKSRAANNHKQKLGIRKVWSQCRPNFSPNIAFLLDFTRILWFFSSLRLKLFDIAKDTVFAKILVFSNIFGFLVVNWTPKWTKTVYFGCVLFEPKLKIWKIFQTLCLS